MIATLIGGPIWLGMVGGLAWLYILPLTIAFRRRHCYRWIVLSVDLMFGASIAGWLWALFWATRAPRATAGGPSALDVLTDDVRTLLLGRAAAAPTGGDPASVGATVREIEHLGRLRASGALTHAEFELLKAGVLRRPCLNAQSGIAGRCTPAMLGGRQNGRSGRRRRRIGRSPCGFVERRGEP